MVERISVAPRSVLRLRGHSPSHGRRERPSADSSVCIGDWSRDNSAFTGRSGFLSGFMIPAQSNQARKLLGSRSCSI